MTFLIVGLIGLIIGGGSSLVLFKRRKSERIKEEATILLEKVKLVCKLVTVEGNFMEVLDHLNKKSIFFGLFSQDKRALLIIRAKALVGLDLSKSKIELDIRSKKIFIKELPEPEILSVESDIQYYDIQQSIFNKFKPDEYTNLNRQAIEKIRNQINESNLPKLAYKQAKDTLSLIQTITEAVGWNLEIGSDRLEQKYIER